MNEIKRLIEKTLEIIEDVPEEYRIASYSEILRFLLANQQNKFTEKSDS